MEKILHNLGCPKRSWCRIFSINGIKTKKYPRNFIMVFLHIHARNKLRGWGSLGLSSLTFGIRGSCFCSCFRSCCFRSCRFRTRTLTLFFRVLCRSHLWKDRPGVKVEVYRLCIGVLRFNNLHPSNSAFNWKGLYWYIYSPNRKSVSLSMLKKKHLRPHAVLQVHCTNSPRHREENEVC